MGLFTPNNAEIQRSLAQALAPLEAELAALRKENASLREVIPKIEDANSIPGRRIFFTMQQNQAFTSSTALGSGQPMFFPQLKDGYFVMTHYPCLIWKPTNGVNNGMWRPVSSSPLPTQTISSDIIDVGYELLDVGPNRFMQNSGVLTGNVVCTSLLTRPDAFVQLPLPAIFAINTVLALIPTYNEFTFASGETPTTAGKLYALLAGYKIVNR